MTRGTRTLVVVGVAVVTALLASFAAYQAVTRMQVQQVEVASVFVVVAARTLPTGTLIKAEDVKLIGWPAQTPMPGALATADEVVGRGLVAPLIENEPLTEGKLAPREAGSGLPPTIPPGMRALAIRVNDLIGVAGFVLAGTHVDIVATIKLEQESMTRVVAANILVLAAGTLLEGESATTTTPVAPATVVTLLVTPADAQRITLAAADGQIVLALRNPLDTKAVIDPGIRTVELMGAMSSPPVRALSTPAERTLPLTRATATVVPAPPRARTVEVIRGLKRSEEIVE